MPTAVIGPHPSPVSAQLTAEFKRLFNKLGANGDPLPPGGVAKGLEFVGWRRSKATTKDKQGRKREFHTWEKTRGGISCSVIVVPHLRRIGCITFTEKPMTGPN